MNHVKRFLRNVFWVLMTAAIAWVVRKMFQRAGVEFGANRRAPARRDVAPQEAKALFRDPVCGTYVAEDISHLLTKDGRDLHFCSRDCMEHFQRDLGACDDRGTKRLAARA